MHDRDGLWNLGDLHTVKQTLGSLARRLGERPVVHLWNPRQNVSFDLPGGIFMIDHQTTNYRIRCRACTHQPALRYEFLVEGDDGQLYGPIGSTCLFVHTLGADEAFRLGQSIVKAFQDAEKQHLELHRRVMRVSAHPEDYLANFGLKWAARFVREETAGMNVRLVHAVWNVLGPRLPLPRHAYHALLALQRQLDIWDTPRVVKPPPRAPLPQGSVAHSAHTVLRPANATAQARTERQLNTGFLQRIQQAARKNLHASAPQSGAMKPVQLKPRPKSNYSTLSRPARLPVEPVIRSNRSRPKPKNVGVPRPPQQPVLQGRKKEVPSKEAAQRNHRVLSERSDRPLKEHRPPQQGHMRREAAYSPPLRQTAPARTPAPSFTRAPLLESSLQVVTFHPSADPWLANLTSVGLPSRCPTLATHPDAVFRKRIERHYEKKRKLDSSDAQLLRALLRR